MKISFVLFLAYALRDGVLLCHVASTICPEAIDQRNVNQRPQFAQFLCLKNIRVFLTACRDGFNLAETDLFQPGKFRVQHFNFTQSKIRTHISKDKPSDISPELEKGFYNKCHSAQN